MTPSKCFRTLRTALSIAFCGAALHAQTPLQQAAARTEFFETKVRPVLVNNCQMCHNTKAKTAQLDLTSASGFLAGGQSGPVVDQGHPESSRLLRAVGYEENLKMPPRGKLKPEEIADITAWVTVGAPWPGAEVVAVQTPVKTAVTFTPEQKSYWAFQKLSGAAVPEVKNTGWVRSPIDRFILAKLEEHSLAPAPRADKAALLRRATYDLTGLPPTEAEMQDFALDSSPNAWEKVIDRLLASPRYGERWGRHWLDVARYADSTGNDEDHRYAHAWRYRDYVIKAFNKDLPYNRFVTEQLAGDLLPAGPAGAPNRDGIVATGFLALGAKALAQQDKKKMLYDIYDEQVDVTSRAFLGLTMACARCHNHKFDPILARDYYGMVSIFASTRDFEASGAFVSKLLEVPLVPKAQFASYQKQQDQLNLLKMGREAIASEEAERYVRTASDHLAEYMGAAAGVQQDPRITAALDPRLVKKWAAYLAESSKAHPQLAEWDNAPADKRQIVGFAYQKRFQTQFEEWAKIFSKWRGEVAASLAGAPGPAPEKPVYKPEKDLFFYETFEHGPFDFSEDELGKLESVGAREKIAALQKQSDAMKVTALPEPDLAAAVEDGEPVNQKVLIRGDYNNPGEDAPKTIPKILSRAGDPSFGTGSGRRELAEWMTRPDNPLPARVMVNRVWQWHFGEGLVRTPDNFGRMGDRPSHPELLDFLARNFVDQGWSIKRLTKMIMLSNTYQTSSDADIKTVEADQENRWLAHFNRQRLDVEEVRDGILALDGSLDPAVGGTLQKGRGTDLENSSDRLSLDPLKLTRRTVYLPIRRANLPGLFNLFDYGDATTVTGKRSLTNVAPQALFMMNSSFVFDHARKVAEFVLWKDVGGSARVAEAYRRILNRAPDAGEVDSSLTYVQKYRSKFGGEASEASAWASLCHVLVSSNEFLYVD